MEVDKKKADAAIIASDVSIEKAKVTKENDKAEVEATACNKIAKEADEKKT